MLRIASKDEYVFYEDSELQATIGGSVYPQLHGRDGSACSILSAMDSTSFLQVSTGIFSYSS